MTHFRRSSRAVLLDQQPYRAPARAPETQVRLRSSERSVGADRPLNKSTSGLIAFYHRGSTYKMPEQKGKVGRTWLLSLGIAGGIGLWIWYRDYQRTDLRMQQEALYLSYKTAHATAKIGTRCEKTIGEPVIGDRKGFVVDESDSKLHALHHEMIAARRPAVLSEVGFIAMLAHSTQRHGAYGIGAPAFSSIIDLAIIDPEKECIILRRRFENLPPDAIRVKRNNLLADVIADPPLKAVIDFLNGS